MGGVEGGLTSPKLFFLSNGLEALVENTSLLGRGCGNELVAADGDLGVDGWVESGEVLEARDDLVNISGEYSGDECFIAADKD